MKISHLSQKCAAIVSALSLLATCAFTPTATAQVKYEQSVHKSLFITVFTDGMDYSRAVVLQAKKCDAETTEEVITRNGGEVVRYKLRATLKSAEGGRCFLNIRHDGINPPGSDYTPRGAEITIPVDFAELEHMKSDHLMHPWIARVSAY